MSPRSRFDAHATRLRQAYRRGEITRAELADFLFDATWAAPGSEAGIVEVIMQREAATP